MVNPDNYKTHATYLNVDDDDNDSDYENKRNDDNNQESIKF